mmetsp:Transcript_22127/g.48123  ORF Transcript_22127/g.48123 Transcript_22127/m.48123 type:complete len:271 (-) Transcript_22127:8-820(-)
MELVRNELRFHEQESKSESELTRKIYAMTGHGVPSGLLQQLVDAARGWLQYQHPSTAPNLQLQHASSPSKKIMFASTPHSTLLDRDRIMITNTHGTIHAFPSLPKEWEHDFEMYMVVMNRMGSRLASLAIPSSSIDADCKTNNLSDDADNSTKRMMESNTRPTLGTGSIVTPSQLKQWNVTIMKGEALPMSLLPNNSLMGSSSGQGGGKRGRHGGEPINNTSKLSLEWVRKENDCCNVILRLQDEGTKNVHEGSISDPISLVFEGEYVPP